MFNSNKTEKPKTLTGTRLRSYAFALLTRRDYSQAELSAKLNQYAIDADEVAKLVAELAQQNYQSDQRVAELTLASQIRKGKGLQRIKQTLKAKNRTESNSMYLKKGDIVKFDFLNSQNENPNKKETDFNICFFYWLSMLDSNQLLRHQTNCFSL